ncbi:MAG: Crp/Fnr family transcriptional regulator [Ectothiorhodospiraceae bacterium]|nr:Crp/Fnr family transcriptional regulator [Ectothiorhodospiraceae bacterium]
MLEELACVTPSTDTIANRLIASLSPRDRQALLAHSEPVQLAFGETLIHAGEPIRAVHFPLSCCISLLTPVEDRAGLEVSLGGDEGMLGVSLILGVDTSPLRAIVQSEGWALRIDIQHFQRQLTNSAAFRHLLQRYLHVLMAQLAQTAACTRFHVMEERLARWLLMTHDRSLSDEFHLTHEFLAMLLGVRRVGITKAAMSLQNRKLIRYRRGDITILDREGLETASCCCYQVDRDSYARMLDR